MVMTIEEILQLSKEKRTSDIHIAPGNPLMLRVDGSLQPQGFEAMSDKDTAEILLPLVPEDLMDELEKEGELDFAFSRPGFSRIRANVFRQRGSYAAALRVLSYDIPAPDTLGIPAPVVNLTRLMRGLVLVTGATGSGKSTTLASLVDVIAKRDAKNIITLEDPIEYLHTNQKSIVSQSEIGFGSMS